MVDVITGPIELVNGGRYRAFIQLSGPCPEPPFSIGAIESVQQAYKALGFGGVQVSETPLDRWPDEFQAPSDAPQCPLYVEWLWAGADQSLPQSSLMTPGVAGVVVWRAEQPSKRRTVRMANEIFKQAWAKESKDPLPDTTRQAYLAISAFEGGFGTSFYANGAPTQDNWGAIHCSKGASPKPGDLWNGCVMGVDANTDGKFAQEFRRYPDPISGARDFIRIVRRNGGTDAIMATGDPAAIAHAMRTYYQGLDPSKAATSEAKYAGAIASNAKSNAKGLGETNLIIQGGAAKKGVSTALVVGGVVVAGLAAYAVFGGK